MQSDPPQGDPRLQKTSPGPIAATGLVDPCIVYLETSLPGEIPLLVGCLARSFVEVKLPGKQSRLELNGILIVQNNAFAKNAQKKLWRIHSRREKTVYLVTDKSGKEAKLSYLSESFATAPAPVFRWSIRFIDGPTYNALRRFKDMTCLARFIFIDSKLDWQSVHDFVTATRNRPSPLHAVARTIASLFVRNKKPQPVPA